MILGIGVLVGTGRDLSVLPNDLSPGSLTNPYQINLSIKLIKKFISINIKLT